MRRDPAARLKELTQRERALAAGGIRVIAGIDEAGRGPLAGPVVAACVAFRPGTWVEGVDDSKKLSARKRARLYGRIMESALAVGLGAADVQTIERINILEATRLASVRALADLSSKTQPEFVFTDSLYIPTDIPHESMVRADSNIYCVAAASIIAKVTRDRIMTALDAHFPQYGFAANKGYGTREHRQAVLAFGPSPVHRMKFLRRLLCSGS